MIGYPYLIGGLIGGLDLDLKFRFFVEGKWEDTGEGQKEADLMPTLDSQPDIFFGGGGKGSSQSDSELLKSRRPSYTAQGVHESWVPIKEPGTCTMWTKAAQVWIWCMPLCISIHILYMNMFFQRALLGETGALVLPPSSGGLFCSFGGPEILHMLFVASNSTLEHGYLIYLYPQTTLVGTHMP